MDNAFRFAIPERRALNPFVEMQPQEMPQSVFDAVIGADGFNPLSNYDDSGRRIAPPDRGRDEMNAVAEAARADDPNYVRGAIYDAVKAAGGDPGVASLASTVGGFVPFVGDAADAEDAARAFGAGDYLTGAMLAGALVLPGATGAVVGGGKKAAKKAAKKGIKAFHGSPHDFDKFSMDKIGTGEGAQAYGHGLYFADSEGVARSYRDELSKKYSGVQIESAGGLEDTVADELNSYLEEAGWDDLTGLRNVIADKASRTDDWDLMDAFDEMVDGGRLRVLGPDNAGHLYEVNINADPADFLDWDKPLSEQPNIAKKLGLRIRSEREINDEAYELFDRYGSYDVMPDQARTRLDELNAEINLPGTHQTGGDLYNHGIGEQENVHNFLSPGTERGAYRSKDMLDSGIPGIKYLDGISRSRGEGTHNYVVFDDALIEIVRKYGIAAAVASGVISEEMARQMQAQGDI